MTICWTSTDFLIQWVWVALIVVLAVIICIRRANAAKRNAKNNVTSCDGCPVKDSCSGRKDDCDRTPDENCDIRE